MRHDLDTEDVKSGWMKMRGSLKNWHLRYFVLRPGKLIYYRNETDPDCQGIIRLKGCQVTIRPTDLLKIAQVALEKFPKYWIGVNLLGIEKTPNKYILIRISTDIAVDCRQGL